jgi:hypothetical protein
MSEKHGPNGFMLGLIIGGAVGALVSTQKGRKILKDLADYGLDYVGKTVSMEDIETILNESEEDMMGGEMGFEEKVSPAPKAERTQEPVKEVHSRRRLFRGIRKK